MRIEDYLVIASALTGRLTEAGNADSPKFGAEVGRLAALIEANEPVDSLLRVTATVAQSLLLLDQPSLALSAPATSIDGSWTLTR